VVTSPEIPHPKSRHPESRHPESWPSPESWQSPESPESRDHRGSAIDRITIVGLVFETAAGLRRSLTLDAGGGLATAGQWFEVLIRLERSPNGRLRMSDLAAQTGLTPSGLTRAVDRLVAEELVERSSCPTDRRGAFAVLTDSGRERVADALTRHRRQLDELFKDLYEPEEESLLAETLRRLRDRVNPEATRLSKED
jgi:MarR family 2-MHQ and catechol resistance regulon transcriptional repressor